MKILENEKDKIIKDLKNKIKELYDYREGEYQRFLNWRNIEGKNFACKNCGGSGIKAYSNTSTWNHGCGGQMITSDVCDRCWGSGRNDLKWADKILVMEQIHKERIMEMDNNSSTIDKIEVLYIEDKYKYLDKELVALLKEAAYDYFSE